MSEFEQLPAALRSASAVFDALTEPIALLDERAVIVWTNAAWGRLAASLGVQGEAGHTFPETSLVARGLRVRSLGVGEGTARYVIVSEDDRERQLQLELDEARGQLRDVRQQLVQAQKLEAIGRLTGGVAHDFNNILTSIICFTRFVVDDMSQEDPRRADLIEVLKSADNAARLSSQLLAFSRRKPLSPIQLNLNDAVTSVGRVLRRTLGEHVELVIVPSEESLLVTCDPGQFDQLLFNLAVQAKDSLGVGGSIEIRLARTTLGTNDVLSPGEYVEITVSGNTRAQEPPRGTLPPGARDGERSSGLGLATCHAIVERAQGVLVVSDRDGSGTMFRVLLPRGQEQGRVEPRRSSLAPLTLQGTVLVVEDQPVILRTMVRALAQTGLRVLEAGSGEDALAVLESGGRIRPELIVTDVVLPGMSGPRLVERLRVDNPNLKALYVSGYVGEEFAHSVRTDENTGFVMKPFSGRQLAVRAAALLGAKASDDATVTGNR